MAVMISDNKKELIVTCKCSCQDTIHIKVDDKDKDADYYAIQTYMSGNWYRYQEDTVIRCIGRKLKKKPIFRISLYFLVQLIHQETGYSYL